MKSPWSDEKPKIQGRLPTRPRCPNCGEPCDGYTHADGATPAPGDITICIICAAIGIYTDELLVRAPDETEAVLLAADPGVREMRRRVARAIIDAVARGERGMAPAELARRAVLR